MHHLDSWIKRVQLAVTCCIISLFNANMFRMLIHPFSGACDLFVELFHWLCVGVTLWFGWGGVVWYPYAGWSTTHEITQQISRKLLRMDVLTSETCWALSNEIIKQVASSWSLFTHPPIDIYMIRKYYIQGCIVKQNRLRCFNWLNPHQVMTVRPILS